MKANNVTINLSFDQTPGEVFEAVNNVRGWWSEAIEGDTHKLNDEFIYRYKDMHYSRQRLIELIPDKKVVWLVVDSLLTFVKDKKEWNGTKICFEITRNKNKTELRFTHIGLVPELECFDACTGGWSYYIKESLLPLITKGKGEPNPEEKKKNKTVLN